MQVLHLKGQLAAAQLPARLRARGRQANAGVVHRRHEPLQGRGRRLRFGEYLPLMDKRSGYKKVPWM